VVGVRHADILSYALDEYVFYGRRAWNYKLLYAVADVLIPDVIASARSRVCPYCGRRFKGGRYLRRHLETANNGTACRASFRLDRERVVKAYLKLRESIVDVSPKGGRRGYLKLRGLSQPRFRNVGELCEWIRVNGLPQSNT
jgi:hypothetical protein